MIIPKGIICSWNHHHQHTSVFSNKKANRVLEFFYALHTGAVTNLWVLHHNLGHHRHYLDQELDQSRWKKKCGNAMSYWRYSLEVTVTAYYRAWLVGNKHKKQQKQFFIFGLITLLILTVATIYNPLNSILLFILPMIISLFLTSQATYKHHVGLDTKDKFAASYTDLNNFWNIMTGNLGYHTAHHVKPNEHWSNLPNVHAEMLDKIPEENIRQRKITDQFNEKIY
jgi:fatty acid desaturase